ncbi:hypothetical protein RQM65_12930 [Pricia sp. S334]|uniref:Uncharacterized protein n=1 Tax=Pricia mediterranea TaxID=3076079 RepID=A0ABU3L760_9FLAO|nr:hypothetical protein [Pricia sp. S334]MDT7829574.1 hypothetical protein [Pricia sp. S334]
MERTTPFYDFKTRDFPEDEASCFNGLKTKQETLWETTISASSECTYDTTASKMGNLIKVLNFDRIDNHKSGKRVFVKK